MNIEVETLNIVKERLLALEKMPLRGYCRDCGYYAPPSKFRAEPDGTGEYQPVCPICNSDNIEAIYE